MKTIATIFVLFFTLTVFAQEGFENHGACKSDVEKFCKGVERGEGRIISCLKSHSEELSPECKAKKQEVKEKMRNFKEACKEDLKTYCAQVRPRGGRLLACLKTNEAKLSPACQAVIPKK